MSIRVSDRLLLFALGVACGWMLARMVPKVIVEKEKPENIREFVRRAQ